MEQSTTWVIKNSKNTKKSLKIGNLKTMQKDASVMNCCERQWDNNTSKSVKIVENKNYIHWIMIIYYWNVNKISPIQTMKNTIALIKVNTTIIKGSLLVAWFVLTNFVYKIFIGLITHIQYET
jgi:hypothetical protein